jgi:hypothetical protein
MWLYTTLKASFFSSHMVILHRIHMHHKAVWVYDLILWEKTDMRRTQKLQDLIHMFQVIVSGLLLVINLLQVGAYMYQNCQLIHMFI